MHTELHPHYRDKTEAQTAKELIAACVHCGFCLTTCPTYLDTRDERDSPRGRIYLIKNLLETADQPQHVQTHLDRCLSCRSCETTCPSGMQYGALADIARGITEEQMPRSPLARLQRWLLRTTLTRPMLFGFFLGLGQWFRPLLPDGLKTRIPAKTHPGSLPSEVHARKVLLLEGCVQQAAAPGTNATTRRVLDKLGVSVIDADDAGCCGAVDYHLGAHADGLCHMRRNIDTWWPALQGGAEAIISTASGCGLQLSEYGHLLASDPAYAAKAKAVSERVTELSQFLVGENLAALAINTNIGKVAVHTPCTLQHGLKQPQSIENLLLGLGFELATTREQHLCCGSAGTYSILQPERSTRLRDNKLSALTGDQPSVIVSANIGCQLQLQTAADIPVKHWIELLKM